MFTLKTLLCDSKRVFEHAELDRRELSEVFSNTSRNAHWRMFGLFFSLPRQPVHRPKVGTAKLLRGQLVFRTTAISHQKAPNVANWIRRRRGADRMLEAVKPLDLRFEIWFWTKEHPLSSVDLHLVINLAQMSKLTTTPNSSTRWADKSTR